MRWVSKLFIGKCLAAAGSVFFRRWSLYVCGFFCGLVLFDGSDYGCHKKSTLRFLWCVLFVLF